MLVLGWNTPTPESFAGVDLNGGHEQPDGVAAVGERHRFRVINIAPAGGITAWITRGDETVPITLLAKDGADGAPAGSRRWHACSETAHLDAG